MIISGRLTRGASLTDAVYARLEPAVKWRLLALGVTRFDEATVGELRAAMGAARS